MKILFSLKPKLKPVLPLLLLVGIVIVAVGENDKGSEQGTTAGLARVDITPRVPVRMIGYASRGYEGEPDEGKLFARALAIGDSKGELGSLVITAELLGIPRSLRDRVFEQLEKQLGLSSEKFAISATHTHGGPSLSDYMQEMHFCKILPQEEKEHIDEYTDWLVERLVKIGVEAAESRQAANLRWGEGQASFAMNRRIVEDGKWKGMRPNPQGSVDHSLPVLTVTAADEDEKVLGVFLSYACHCTSYSPPKKGFHGDWAGAAAFAIEKRHPDSVALVAAGCGADANPDPRTADAGPFILKHGKEIADQVDSLLADRDRTFLLTAPPECKSQTVQLPLETHPGRKEFEAWTKGKDKRRAFYGQIWLDRIDSGMSVPKTVPYLVQTWRYPGEEDKSLTTAFLPGEVTSGYSLRIKEELNTASRRNWVIGYANESPSYITTAKEIGEGGYEVEGSMLSYDKPSSLSPETEDIIINAVVELAGGHPDKAASTIEIPSRPKPNDHALSPDEAIASMHVKPGLEIELVAAEPLVMDPVAFDWGPDGRLWVVEMRDYPNGLTWNGIDDPLNVPGGRVKVLTDTDKDGRYDEAEIFLDNLPFPTGVKVWDKGVLITSAPNVIYAEDTDGDSIADKQEIWFEGFAKSNQQHRVNGLAWGLDNWLHIANGDGGGIILSKTTRDEVDIRGHDLRIDPFTKKLEPLSGRTQCGRYRDDWGNWFGCNNSNPLWHYPMRYSHLKRNSSLSPPSATVNVPVDPGAAPVYPLSKTLERFNQPDRANRFTSVCGPAIYRDETLGANFKGNAFVCEPVHNLVSRQVLQPRGASFKSDRAFDEKDSEFLASTDNWSRPVSVRTGPDGAIWVADMYRLVIEHPEWIPHQWQEKYDLRAGSDLGRIYRIFPKGKNPGAVPTFDQLNDEELAAKLDQPNGTNRDLIHQMLLWRKAGKVTPVLQELVRSGKEPAARLQALSVLSGLGKLEASTAKVAIADGHPGVAGNAIRICSGILSADEICAAAKKHLSDAAFAKELSGVLGDLKGAESSLTLSAILLRHRDEPYVSATAFSSVNPDNLGTIVATLSLAYTDGPEFKKVLQDFGSFKAPANVQTEKLAMMSSLWKVEPAVKALVHAITSDKSEEAKLWKVSILIGLLERGATLESRTDDPSQLKILSGTIENARKIAKDDSLPEWQRLEAVRLLQCKAVFDPDRDIDLFASWISPTTSSKMHEAAFKALGKTGHAGTAGRLIKRWNALGPADRGAAMQLLMSRGAWTGELLSALETKQIAVSQIDAASRQRLMDSSKKSTKKRSQDLFNAASNTTRAQVLADHASVLQIKPDPAAGKAVFATACIACHVAEGVGNAIGPDLAALTDRSPDSMLVAILDPNRAVEDKYMNYSITRADGTLAFGLIGEENANSITLRAADGSQQQILRKDIKEMASAGISLMPEGLEATLTKQQLTDLIGYVGSLGSKPEPPLSARVAPNSKGVIELRASKCKVTGDRLEFMADFDALGWWTSEKDRAEWTIVLDRPGNYQVEWDYSVSPEAAGNDWQMLINGESALEGKVASSGSWETFHTQGIGEVQLSAADNKVVVRSKGKIDQALLDLRAIRFIPLSSDK